MINLRKASPKEIAEVFVPEDNNKCFELWLDINAAKSASGENAISESELEFWNNSFSQLAEFRTIDYSSEAVSKIREIVAESMSYSDKFLAAVRNSGLPIVAMANSQTEYLSTGFDSLIIFSGGTSLDKSDKNNVEQDSSVISYSPISAFHHEWMHWVQRSLINAYEVDGLIERMRNRRSLKIAQLSAEKYWDDGQVHVGQIKWGESVGQNDIPYVDSKYGRLNKMEMLAEGAVAFFHASSWVNTNKINGALRDDIQKITGVK